MPSRTPHIILIDGRSGVGKTSLALTMAEALDATVVHLDDVYPGWGGLAAGRDAVIDSVLRAIREGRTARIRQWDWERSVPGLDVTVAPSDVVIIEGCGISTETSRSLADVTMWVDCDDDERLERLARRDGDRFDDYVELWETQVNDHIRVDDPAGNAAVMVRT